MNSNNHSSEVGQRVEKKQLAKVSTLVAQLPIFSLAAQNATIPFKHSDGVCQYKIDVTGNLLCPVAQSILLQIISDAGLNGKRLLRKNADGRPAEILRRLAPDAENISTIVGDVAIVTVYHADLVASTGLADCEATSALVLRCLQGLSNVIIKTRDIATRLLAYSPLEDGNFNVVLSPGLSDAARFGGKYAGIRVDERNLLVTAEARLMHAWLSTKLWPGNKKTFPLWSLAQAVWPYPIRRGVPEWVTSAMITQHFELLNNCGWKVTVSDEGVTIWRPGLGLPPRYGALHPFHPDYKPKKRRPTSRVSEVDLLP